MTETAILNELKEERRKLKTLLEERESTLRQLSLAKSFKDKVKIHLNL